MNIIASARRAAGFVVLGMASLLLAGCMLTSTENLVGEDETVQVLPATFTLQTYNEAADGSFSTSEEAGGLFTLTGKGYTDDGESMTIYLVPLGEDKYLVDVVAADGTMYGVARLKDGIVELRMVFSGDPATELGASVPAGVTVADGGIAVADRAALDTVITLIDEGKLGTSLLIAWVGEGEAPALIVRDGDWYKAA
jgi:hypothetical protein